MEREARRRRVCRGKVKTRAFNRRLRHSAKQPPFCTNRRKGWATQKRFGGSRGGHPRVASGTTGREGRKSRSLTALGMTSGREANGLEPEASQALWRKGMLIAGYGSISGVSWRIDLCCVVTAASLLPPGGLRRMFAPTHAFQNAKRFGVRD